MARKTSPPSPPSAYRLAEATAATKKEAARALQRAQTLTSAAEDATDAALLPNLREAVSYAYATPDPYQTMRAMAQTLAVALKRGQHAFVSHELEKLLQLAPRVEPLASRAAALRWLWNRLSAAGPALSDPIWNTIVSHCPPDRSWRAARLYHDIAEVWNREEPGAWRRVAAAMPDGKARAKLERRFPAKTSR